MAGNHLEDLVAEWYEFQGYFVRQNVQVGRRPNGEYECELDVVAFNPEKKHLIQIEPSLDSDSWAEREHRYRKKFEAGRKYVPKLFRGIELPREVEQIALYALAGGAVMHISAFMDAILAFLRDRPVRTAAVPETYPLLRTYQFGAQWWPIAGKGHKG
jgi:hypothetical protein